MLTNRPRRPRSDRDVATTLAPLLHALFGDGLPVRFECWDGTAVGPQDAPGVVRIRSENALRRLLWAPGELGLARAYVTGDLDIDGDVFRVLRALQETSPENLRFGPKAIAAVVRASARLAALGPPLPPPREEAATRGLRHSKPRDARVISHHYDVGNDFYRLVLGPSMTYSCARFAEPSATLEDAQTSKHELICRKLGLHEHPGLRLLDVGCGWGSLALHAAKRHAANVVGITISQLQADLARKRVAEAGVAGMVEIRVQDYRSLSGETFDAVSSVGMFEHVGIGRTAEYFTTLRSLLGAKGRLLNHAISSVGGSRLGHRSFMGRYVFPDGELIDVADVVLAMERAGFEVRDVESLREHYARTLRAWIANLESNWDAAVAEVGVARAKVWRLYMAGSTLGFEDGGVAVHQVLGVVADGEGHSGMPSTRQTWG